MSREIDAPGFLKRWSDKKQSATSEAVPKEALGEQDQQQQLVASVPEQPTENLPLPSLDDIIPGSDVSVFFQKHVPETLRAAALRKLWTTDPDIKDFIEMADHQWDFTNPDAIPGWSSTVDGVDLKAMVDKIFGGAVKKEPEPEAGAENCSVEPDGANTDSNIEMEVTQKTAISETNSETSVLSETLVAAPAFHPEQGQKITDKSSVYDIIPKRHGSALPT